MRRILVPIDFSDATKKIIEQAIKYAKSLGGEIRLLHVAAPEPEFIGDEVGPKVLRDQKAKRLRDQHKKIQKLAGNIEKEGIKTTPLLVQGVTVDEIIKESKKFNASIIIMGSHGHGAMYNLLMGSVIEGVIRTSKIPVLVIPVKSK
ncbi:MAG: universal stress protein [Ignavibacteriales bacterium]|jgi:nucleotide-binding universal stress UspA family protein|nr:MAG: universal stress protein [Ignavibacteriales bacterium]